MRLIKSAMLVMATLGTFGSFIAAPVSALAGAYMSIFPRFWEKFFTIVLHAFEAYLEIVIRRGYFRVGVPSAPIVEAFSNQTDVIKAAEKGLVFDGHSLTVPQDICVYIKDDVGVALQAGEYPIDAQGNFQFNLIRVPNPVPSEVFPIPASSGY